MANEKWTPGPWTKQLIIEHPWGPEYEIHGPGGDEEGAVICSVGYDAVEANTALICAAPELYEALNRLRDRIIDNCDRAFLTEAAEDLAIARRAAAKARGEASK